MALAKVVRKTTLHDANDEVRDVAYWLSRPVAERLAAVEELRRPVMEALPLAEQRLQRVFELLRSNGVEFLVVGARAGNGLRLPVISVDDLIRNKLATGRSKDLADVEALRGR